MMFTQKTEQDLLRFEVLEVLNYQCCDEQKLNGMKAKK